MLILHDHEAAVVIERLFELEKRDPKYQDRDKYGRTLAEKLALYFSHSEGKEF